MLDVRHFSKQIPMSDAGGGYRYGLANKEVIARELRDFADRVESGEISITTIRSNAEIHPNGYYAQTMVIEFDENEPPGSYERRAPERIIDLPGK